MADATILIFWLVCVIRGFFRGPVSELFSIAGAIVGLFTADWFYSLLSKVFPRGIGSMQIRDIICFLLVFSGMYLLMIVTGVIAAYLLRLSRTGWINRALGTGLGTVKGVLVVALLLVPLIAFLPGDTAWVAESVILSHAARLSEKVAWAIPSVMQVSFSTHIDGYKQVWQRKQSFLNDHNRCNQKEYTVQAGQGISGRVRLSALRVNIGTGLRCAPQLPPPVIGFGSCPSGFNRSRIPRENRPPQHNRLKTRPPALFSPAAACPVLT